MNDSEGLKKVLLLSIKQVSCGIRNYQWDYLFSLQNYINSYIAAELLDILYYI